MFNMSEQEKTEFRDSIVEAVSGVIDKRMQENAVRQEEFENKIVGLIKNLNSSHAQASSLSDKVDVHEGVIKNNILPRLDILESSTI